MGQETARESACSVGWGRCKDGMRGALWIRECVRVCMHKKYGSGRRRGYMRGMSQARVYARGIDCGGCARGTGWGGCTGGIIQVRVVHECAID